MWAIAATGIAAVVVAQAAPPGHPRAFRNGGEVYEFGSMTAGRFAPQQAGDWIAVRSRSTAVVRVGFSPLTTPASDPQVRWCANETGIFFATALFESTIREGASSGIHHLTYETLSGLGGRHDHPLARGSMGRASYMRDVLATMIPIRLDGNPAEQLQGQPFDYVPTGYDFTVTGDGAMYLYLQRGDELVQFRYYLVPAVGRDAPGRLAWHEVQRYKSPLSGVNFSVVQCSPERFCTVDLDGSVTEFLCNVPGGARRLLVKPSRPTSIMFDGNNIIITTGSEKALLTASGITVQRN